MNYNCEGCKYWDGCTYKNKGKIILKGNKKGNKKERWVNIFNQDKRLEIILESLEGIELSEEEMKFIEWISKWDIDTMNYFISIVHKLKLL